MGKMMTNIELTTDDVLAMEATISELVNSTDLADVILVDALQSVIENGVGVDVEEAINDWEAWVS